MGPSPPPLPPRKPQSLRSAPSIHPQAHPLSTPWVHGSYYPSWRIYRGAKPSSMDLAITTHLFYAFARVHPDGTIYRLDEKADLQLPVDGMTGCLAACLAQKRSHPHLRLLLSIGGSSGSSTFAEVASSEVTRDRFAASARQFIDKYNFDGVDIDWEHPKDPVQGRNYLCLLQTCRNHFPSSQYLLTSALPTGEWCLRNIDISTVATTLDWINLMCYDFSGPWTELSGHQSQLYSPEQPHNAFAKRSCDAAVKYLFSRGVLGSKIVIGIPVYGRSFLGTNNIGQKFTGHFSEADGVIEYKDLPRAGAVEYVDWSVGAAFSVGGDAGFVSYDVPITVTAKAQFVKQMGLRGLFYWTGVADAPPDRADRGLIRAGWTELHK